MNVSNTTTTTRTSTETTGNVVSIASKTRRTYGARSFGVGYGKSSGYAADKRYTTDWGQIRFRCA
jgi:hypothetical protein